MINIMKDAYDINIAPTILLNEETKLEGVTKQEDIEKYLVKSTVEKFGYKTLFSRSEYARMVVTI